MKLLRHYVSEQAERRPQATAIAWKGEKLPTARSSRRPIAWRACWRRFDRLPLDANGKVDRKALKELFAATVVDSGREVRD